MLFGCKLEEADEAYRPIEFEHYQVSLIAVGDNLIHHTIYESAYQDGSYDFKPFYQDVKPFIQQHDLAFINQETILGGTELGLSTWPRFNSPYECGDAIIDAGFNLISIANNHTLDKGEAGVLNAIDYFEEQDIIFSGALKQEKESQLKIFTRNNITFGFIAYTTLTNGLKHPQNKTYLANVYSKEKAQEEILEVRDQVDFIIVSMHWGSEYIDLPTEEQQIIAKDLNEVGADLILGHHPHVIQPIHKIRSNQHETIVAYSLGNFFSDQTGINKKIGASLQLQFDKRVTNDHVIKKISNLQVRLIHHGKLDNRFYVKWFEEIDDSYLPNYQIYKDDKMKVIQYYDQTILDFDE